MEKDTPQPGRSLAVSRPARTVAAVSAGMVVPAIVADAGDAAAKRFLEFFAATIRNRNTRVAYLHAAGRFFAWCERHRIGQLVDIEPLHVAAYIEALGKDFEKPTVKQHLAAIRMLFDWLVCTFRATGITAYLEAGGTLENAQAMAAHESPRTTKLYDRTGDEITLDEVERIAI
jgi:hypothetical protein